MRLRPPRVACVYPTLLLLFGLLAVAASVPAREAPNIKSISVLDSLTGDSTVVAGSVVYVDFWASWCVPCRRSFPWMVGLQERYHSRGLQILTINVDRDAAAAHKFLDDTGAHLPVVYDPGGKLARVFDLETMPSSFVYGRDGTLRRSLSGFNPEETESVESLIVELLQEERKP